MSVKKCCKCLQVKNIDEFGNDKYTADGKQYKCKSCANSYAKEYRKAHPVTTIEWKCKACKQIKLLTKESIKRKKTEFCSSCYSKSTQAGVRKPHLSNKNSARWNGGEYITTDGYKVIKQEGQFDKSGRQIYKREHILVMEQHLGRELKTEQGYMGEQVHHIDGNKLNNSLDNLVYCQNTKEHRLLHSSLEKIAYELVKAQKIKFNKDNNQYYISDE